MEISEIRRRLRGALDAGRHEAAERRARTDLASRDYEQFLETRAVPVFQQLAVVLNSEGHPFKVFTPAGSVRLASERSPEEFLELTLDTAADPPEVLARTSRGRGRRLISEERPLRPGLAVADLKDEDVLEFLLREIVPLLQR
jgi:hypothetical protein